MLENVPPPFSKQKMGDLELTIKWPRGSYLYIFIIAIEGPARGYPLRTYFLQFFNGIVIKKTAVLNQVIFWILERFLLLNSFKYN